MGLTLWRCESLSLQRRRLRHKWAKEPRVGSSRVSFPPRTDGSLREQLQLQGCCASVRSITIQVKKVSQTRVKSSTCDQAPLELCTDQPAVLQTGMAQAEMIYSLGNQSFVYIPS